MTAWWVLVGLLALCAGWAWLRAAFGRATEAVDGNLAPLPTDDDDDLPPLPPAPALPPVDVEELKRDLSAIQLAIEEGRVDTPSEIAAVITLCQYELDLAGAA